ncbi:glycosyltransferase family 2 protein [Thiolapillus brandeum]|uniref:Glycosyl transferase family 2 n=1 Tax=Thiolapillus brandeum TaxID=1076588 RepID=A0A7U6GHE7_9GAMM|nr:glycosyltransferase family 2 protein [Thiolapillus brandeum]BAO43685.1 glycosyl transferase family 2 [Thiolapillus brandeum]
MSHPQVTVVVPLYNKEQTIVRCIDSVLSQSHEDFELLVIDDGSTDGGADRVKNMLDTRIQLHRQTNAGPSSARNKGLDLARGDFVAFLDADDEWRPRHLEFLLQGFHLFPGAVLVCNDLVEARGGKLSQGARQFDLPTAEASLEGEDYHLLQDYLQTLADGHFILSGSSVMLRTHIVRDASLWFLSEAEPAEDVNYWIRLSGIGPFVYCSYQGAVYHRDDPDSIMNRLNRMAAPVPPFLESVEVGSLSGEQQHQLRRFLSREYLKKAYQNRGKPGTGQEYRLSGQAGISPGMMVRLAYVVIRYVPEWLFQPALSLRRSLRR